MSKALKVNGTNISEITVGGGYIVLQKWSGIHAPGIAFSLPELVAESWPGIQSMKVPRKAWGGYHLQAPSEAALESLIDAMVAVVVTTGVITLTRERLLLSGIESVTAPAVYAGGMDQFEYASHSSGKVTPEWQLMEDWS